MPSPYLQDQLHHLGVHQPMDRLPVDMGYQIPFTQPGLVGWTTFLHVLPTRRGRLISGEERTGLLARSDSKPIHLMSCCSQHQLLQRKVKETTDWHSQAQKSALLRSSQHPASLLQSKAASEDG